MCVVILVSEGVLFTVAVALNTVNDAMIISGNIMNKVLTTGLYGYMYCYAVRLVWLHVLLCC